MVRSSGGILPSKGASLIVFLLWALYSVSYFGKVNFSANITQIIDFYQISKAEAGIVPSLFFFSYGAGQVFNGLFCKKYNIKWAIFISLFASSIINLIVALTTDFNLVKWLWLLNGFLLSILWPTIVRLISETIPQRDLGSSSVIMGTTVAVGTLIIYCLSSLYASFDMFKLAFYTAAVADAVIAFLWLALYKRAVNKSKCEKAKEGSAENIVNQAEQTADATAAKKVFTIAVILICIYAVIVNLIKDGLTTWVPSILKEEFSLSDWLSILLTLGLPIVAIFGNLCALKMHNKIPDYITHCFIVFSVLGVFVIAIILSISLKQMLLALIGLMVVNFFASSLNSLVTGIFPIFMRGKINSGLFAGVLNGFCYLGSTISSYGLGFIADNSGWTTVFWTLFGCCCFSGLLWGVYIILSKTH